jgi:hypothetical protein
MYTQRVWVHCFQYCHQLFIQFSKVLFVDFDGKQKDNVDQEGEDNVAKKIFFFRHARQTKYLPVQQLAAKYSKGFIICHVA